jgi:hypothetical protein
MGNTGFNTGVARYGNSFSSLRSTRRKRRLRALERGAWLVYFIRAANGMIKIGYARDLWTRLRTLQSGHSEPLEILVYSRGDPVTEERLHEAFRRYRRGGEWFEPAPPLLAYIADLQAVIDAY